MPYRQTVGLADGLVSCKAFRQSEEQGVIVSPAPLVSCLYLCKMAGGEFQPVFHCGQTVGHGAALVYQVTVEQVPDQDVTVQFFHSQELFVVRDKIRVDLDLIVCLCQQGPCFFDDGGGRLHPFRGIQAFGFCDILKGPAKGHGRGFQVGQVEQGLPFQVGLGVPVSAGGDQGRKKAEKRKGCQTGEDRSRKAASEPKICGHRNYTLYLCGTIVKTDCPVWTCHLPPVPSGTDR